LQLIRVAGRNSTTGGYPVLLQHGLGSCAADWFLNLPSESLGFILADKGYDVWVGNNRGNGYSMRHKIYKPNQPQFWDWTWDAFAQYDLPTEINYVLNTTGKKSLTYMGISQGTTQAFAGFSEQPSLSSKVDLFVAFAPVAYVYNQRSILLQVLSFLELDRLIELFGDGESTIPAVIHKLLPFICDADPQRCEYVMSWLMGPSISLNASRVGFYAEYEIAPTSVWNMGHWAQGVRLNAFQHMDWGREKNIQKYGQPTPPPYDLSKFPPSLPYALFTGGEDYLADAEDVKHLLSLLPRKPDLVVYEPKFSHVDYVLSYKANQQIYPQVLSLLAKHKKLS